MADGLTPQDPLQTPVDVPPVDPSDGGGGASPRRQTVIIIAAVVVLLMIIGAVVFFVLPSLFGGDGDDQIAKTPATSSGARSNSDQSTATPSAATVPEEPELVPLGDVFTFRDIFEVLLPEPTEEGTSGGTTPPPSDGDTSTPDVSENTLYLDDIVILDGVPYAVLLWNGQEYVLTEGESIPDTPWQVLTIEEDSVVMLYGDVQVTLTIGQGVTK